MRGLLLRVLLLVCVVGGVTVARSNLALAAEPAATVEPGKSDADATFPVAVIRLDKLFKENAVLQSRLEPLKAEAAELDKNIQLRQAEIETAQARLTRTPQGSPEFEKLQLQLARLRTELQLMINRERQKLLDREGQAHMAVFRDVEAVVRDYCKQRGIRLVLRHQDPADGENLNFNAVLGTLNRGIIYADDLDITDDIARLLAARQQEARR